MEERINNFRNFIAKYPAIREEVTSGSKTWQDIYQDFILLGENDERFKQYTNYDNTKKETSKLPFPKLDTFIKNSNIKEVVDYVKKINPDNLNKTLNTVQKVLQITQNFGGKANPALYNANYNSWWD